MNSIIKSKIADIEQQFNEVAESIEANNQEIKRLQKEVFELETNAVFLKGKYEGLFEALEIVEEKLSETVSAPDAE